MVEKGFNLIIQHQDQCKEQTVAPTFLAQCSFHWSIPPPRLKIDPYLLKVFPLKTACHHPTCSRLPLPKVLVAGVSMWALHNLQKAESTKLNWPTREDKSGSPIFSMLISVHMHSSAGKAVSEVHHCCLLLYWYQCGREDKGHRLQPEQLFAKLMLVLSRRYGYILPLWMS